MEKIKIMTKLWYCDIRRWSDIVTGQERSCAIQGRNEVSFGSKFTVLKNVHVTLLGLSGASRSHVAPPAVIRRPIVIRQPGNALVTPLMP